MGLMHVLDDNADKLSQQSRFPGGGGSLRDAQAHERIIEATLALLDEVGFAKLSVDAVASRAGVAKPTIYRWWKNKTHLVYEAALRNPEIGDPPSSGDFETDLRSFVEAIITFLWRPEILAAHLGLLADPETEALVHKEISIPGRRRFSEIIDSGVEQGKVAPGFDVDLAFDVAMGGLFYQSLTMARRTAVPSVDEVIDLVVNGLGGPRQPARRTKGKRHR